MNTRMASGRRQLIKRPRLTRLLDGTTARAIVLVAPAGYGKTTLAHEWLTQSGRRAAWYEGGPASGDVAALAAGIARALRRFVPGCGERLLQRLAVTPDPGAESLTLAELLAGDLAAWPHDAWLVIDDYHRLAESEASEAFVESLLKATRMRLVATTRVRPRWVRTRDVLYGGICELGARELALTDTEARQLLGDLASEASELVRLAAGWPAALSLATIAREASPPAAVPDALHDYLAEELYQRAAPELQTALEQLALTPELVPTLTDAILGPTSGELLTRAEELGFVTCDRRGHTLHPLLRAFLVQKLRARAERADTVRAVVDALTEHGYWHETFEVVTTFRAFALLDDLIARSSEKLLQTGQSGTLSRWIDYARAHAYHSDALDVAEAELALRAADYSKAELLASRAAKALPHGHSLIPRAWLAAARAAHLANRAEIGLAYASHAEETARAPDHTAQALWLAFLFTRELELPCAEPLLDRLRAVPGIGPTYEVRVAAARAALSRQAGELTEVLDAVLPHEHLLARVTDPMIRTSYVNTVAYNLVLNARYREAVGLSLRGIADADAHRLTFVRAHIAIGLAMAYLGVREFVRADRVTADTARVAAEIRDRFLIFNARLVTARLLLMQKRFDDAAELTAEEPATDQPRGVQGEYWGLRAIALACVGDAASALEAADRAVACTHMVEACLLAQWARLIVGITTDGRTGENTLHDAFRSTISSGAYDPLVLAYRAEPRILRQLAGHAPFRQRLAWLIDQTSDHALARTARLHVARLAGISSPLTAREAEVIELVRQGMSNRAIAEALYISEATVKAHLRHIFEKLDVQSRTEVAIRATLDVVDPTPH